MNKEVLVTFRLRVAQDEDLTTLLPRARDWMQQEDTWRVLSTEVTEDGDWEDDWEDLDDE